MYLIRIEHPVPDYEVWKRAFDSDPMGRSRAGVRRFRIFRSVQTPNHVLIDLEFDGLDQAEMMLVALRSMWSRVEGTVMSNARAQIVEQVEDTMLAGSP